VPKFWALVGGPGFSPAEKEARKEGAFRVCVLTAYWIFRR
jgi:hypothetical protein